MTPVYDEVRRHSIYKNVQLFIGSKNDILKVAMFKYSLRTFGVTTVKHYFFRRILILQFHVENSLHFNFADFPVNFIKRFLSCFFWYL